MSEEKMNLCEFCLRTYSECMNRHENLPDIKYGLQDSVLKCDWFMAKPKEPTNDKN